MADTDGHYTAGTFALDIDGYNVGFLKKFSGLAMEADIVAQRPRPGQRAEEARRRTSSGRPARRPSVSAWARACTTGSSCRSTRATSRRTARSSSGDFNYKAQSRLDFEDALITEVTVPKLDGSSKDAAYFDVEFEPEQVRWAKGGGEDIRGKVGPKQKAWLCSNFRVEIGGSLPCSARRDRSTRSPGSARSRRTRSVSSASRPSTPPR